MLRELSLKQPEKAVPRISKCLRRHKVILEALVFTSDTVGSRNWVTPGSLRFLWEAGAVD